MLHDIKHGFLSTGCAETYDKFKYTGTSTFNVPALGLYNASVGKQGCKGCKLVYLSDIPFGGVEMKEELFDVLLVTFKREETFIDVFVSVINDTFVITVPCKAFFDLSLKIPIV